VNVPLGELAALGTAACWTGTALSFEAAGRRIGSLSVNLIKLVFAFAMLCVWGKITRGLWFPFDATPHAWAWLSVSALAGFVFGDFCLFRAFVVLGPRLSALIMSTVPMFTALIGLFLLDEALRPTDALGMALVIGGIAWAVLDRHAGGPDHRPSLLGIVLALGGALGQASGLVLSKFGMGDYDAFAATQIRVLAGIGGFVVLGTALRWWPKIATAVKDGPAMKYTFIGAAFGPFLGVGLSLVSIQLAANTGVAAAIMATTPIMLIPIVVFRGERVGTGGVFGALLAVGGVTVLFLT
jgi:drug/metabolite transporter (DMT)-like permease